jgi:hypothetical protein
MRLTKEQARGKMPLIKAHYWFGSDQLKFVIKLGYDYYIDDDNAMFYIYQRKH